MHLSDDLLRQLVRGADTDLLTANSDEMQHLENCADCQSRLASLSGETDWFAGLSGEFAKLPPSMMESIEPWIGENGGSAAGDSIWESRITLSLSQNGLSPDLEHKQGLHSNFDGTASNSEHHRIRTDFLPPGSHPELLGRLGRYDIEETIGAGGFGIVFKAYDTELRRVVALKVLAPHLMSSGAARKRFTREAQAAAAIVHEHVIPIYDVVNQPDSCYLVMQYIAGPSLQERVDAAGPLAVPEVLRIGCQIAAGLRAAHQQGLVHRDVKPANILLEQSVDRVLISDFGLARTADDANLTRSGAITGTPHYMSPEQASGALVDARSDLFSLGSVLYFAFTGRPAFRAPQIVAVLNRICHFPHRRVTEINSEIPAPIADMIDRLLEKNPEQRFQSAQEVERELQALLADWQSGNMAARIRVTSPPATSDQQTQAPVLQPPLATSVPAPRGTGSQHAGSEWKNFRWLGSVVAGCALLGLVAVWQPWPVTNRHGQPSDQVGSQGLAGSKGFAGHEAEHNHEANGRAASAREIKTVERDTVAMFVSPPEFEIPAVESNFTFQIKWGLDSDSLLNEMDRTQRHWLYEDEELDQFLSLLKAQLAVQEHQPETPASNQPHTSPQR